MYMCICVYDYVFIIKTKLRILIFHWTNVSKSHTFPLVNSPKMNVVLQLEPNLFTKDKRLTRQFLAYSFFCPYEKLPEAKDPWLCIYAITN